MKVDPKSSRSINRRHRFGVISIISLTTLALAGTAHADLLTSVVSGFSSQLDILGRLGVNTVNATGMSGPGNSGDTCDNNSPNMWMSGGVYEGNDHNPYIAYDLGANYTLNSTRIWQYNEVSFAQASAKDIVISVSADNVTFTPISTNTLNVAGGTATEPNQDVNTPANNVRYVKIQILDNWDGAVYWNGGAGPNGADGRYLTGFSEIRLMWWDPSRIFP
jgi:hypothetical protein